MLFAFLQAVIRRSEMRIMCFSVMKRPLREALAIAVCMANEADIT